MKIENKKQYVSTPDRDYWPTEQWRTAEPQDQGVNPDKLEDLERMINSRYGNIMGIVIIRKGCITFERYYHNHGPQEAHNVTSVTKSVMSALTGIAIGKGYLQSVDQKILDFFPEYKTAPGDILKRTLTIRHLLTMTAPIALKSTGIGNEALDRLRRQPDWIKFILDQLGRSRQPGKFHYSTSGTHLLSAILTHATGMSAREFANKYLFKPLGMREIPDLPMQSFSLDNVFGKNVTGWIKDPGGYTTGGWGLTLTLRDMARFGFLYLNHGQWDNQQIIPAAWIQESTASNSEGYGYLWWLKEEDGLFSYAAAGTGGSLICCIPEKDLVTAIAAKIVRKPPDPWALIKKGILPAILD